jgi:hypothetical protein
MHTKFWLITVMEGAICTQEAKAWIERSEVLECQYLKPGTPIDRYTIWNDFKPIKFLPI